MAATTAVRILMVRSFSSGLGRAGALTMSPSHSGARRRPPHVARGPGGLPTRVLRASALFRPVVARPGQALEVGQEVVDNRQDEPDKDDVGHSLSHFQTFRSSSTCECLAAVLREGSPPPLGRRRKGSPSSSEVAYRRLRTSREIRDRTAGAAASAEATSSPATISSPAAHHSGEASYPLAPAPRTRQWCARREKRRGETHQLIASRTSRESGLEREEDGRVRSARELAGRVGLRAWIAC
jgi:hypothetical protein